METDGKDRNRFHLREVCFSSSTSGKAQPKLIKCSIASMKRNSVPSLRTCQDGLVDSNLEILTSTTRNTEIHPKKFEDEEFQALLDEDDAQTQEQLAASLNNGRNDKLILLHDNARPDVAHSVKDTLKDFKWEVLRHPPYSPDMA
ncbi:hypothetical protein LAZ67_20000224 [Cordylochernes scorpioides]|uniref:Transposase n=1 Tax=Cordylochernes scorpioides TaxID=51811 RepID=A0ABY6LJ58_9ARAC|nr:hypothetical protein LAZ67_20000224 [Cordylochernes scorpioides]